ncbi:hypothetical protein GPJ56_005223 [Histomonas meleagridis]|uniref:uncharacterized protein n=1 Tax=Histomonas meleagridis TaxID=135588 RepID=UPI00355A366C|nr:hypothetical protein GPJ56_005223 [Histomonas meleagridis]KAH0802073.1 hypothetical protein GO595_005154 [Histomonas meleagridis]
MSIEKSLLEKFAPDVNFNVEQPLIAQSVMMGTKKPKDSAYFLVTDVAFYFRVENSSSSTRYSWSSLRKVGLHGNKLKFSFDKKTKIIVLHPEAQIMNTVLEFHACCFCFPSELPKFESSAGIDTSKISITPSLRFLIETDKKNIKIDNQELDKLREFLNSDQTDIHLKDFPQIQSYFDVFIECVQLKEKPRTLYVDIPVDDSVIKLLLSLLKANKTIQKIAFTQEIKTPFDPIAQAFAQCPPISAISFNNIKFSPQVATSICDLLSSKPINSIEIIKCFNNQQAIEFINAIKCSNFSQHIKYLDLSYTPVPLDILFTTFITIERLILVSCELQIPGVFRHIDANQLESLEYLDLSGNAADEPLGNKIPDLPSYVQTLKLENVAWSTPCFCEIFTSIVKHASINEFSVSFANPTNHITIEAVKSPVKSFGRSNIAVLNWSGIDIFPELLEFIYNQESLKELYFDGSKFESGDLTFDLFLFLLKITSNIKYLSLGATEESKLNASQLDALIDSIRENKSLVGFSLKGQNLTDDNLIKLSKALMANRRITKFDFDFLSINNAQTFISFLTALHGRGIKLQMTTPKEVLKQCQNFNSKETEIIKIQNLFQQLQTTNSSIVPPTESVAFNQADDEQKTNLIKLFNKSNKKTDKKNTSETNINSQNIYPSDNTPLYSSPIHSTSDNQSSFGDNVSPHSPLTPISSAASTPPLSGGINDPVPPPQITSLSSASITPQSSGNLNDVVPPPPITPIAPPSSGGMHDPVPPPPITPLSSGSITPQSSGNLNDVVPPPPITPLSPSTPPIAPIAPSTITPQSSGNLNDVVPPPPITPLSSGAISPPMSGGMNDPVPPPPITLLSSGPMTPPSSGGYNPVPPPPITPLTPSALPPGDMAITPPPSPRPSHTPSTFSMSAAPVSPSAGDVVPPPPITPFTPQHPTAADVAYPIPTIPTPSLDAAPLHSTFNPAAASAQIVLPQIVLPPINTQSGQASAAYSIAMPDLGPPSALPVGFSIPPPPPT